MKGMKGDMKAVMKGVSEIIAVIMILIITLTMASMTYGYIGSVYAQQTRPIEIIDAYCMAGNATFVIRNGGAQDINANSLSCRPLSQECSSGCNVPSDIPPGGAGSITATGCSSGRAHTWHLRGPSNNIDLYVYCP